MLGRYIDRTNDRSLPPDFAGHVLLWDIDKTYLDTRFSSLRGLARIPFEVAVDKVTIPGAVALIRALRHGPDEANRLRPLYFVSGSPPQIRVVLERRMTLDGVDFDGITFKDQLGLVLSGQLRSLTGQLGYKLRALLLYRRELPPGARYLCFGDDSEDDAAAFRLFGRVCGGLRGGALTDELRRRRVPAWEVDEILALAEDLPAWGPNPVDGAFIHLARRSAPARLDGEGVVATRSYLQTALWLADRAYVAPETVSVVTKALRRVGLPEARLDADLQDAIRRLGVSEGLARFVA